MDYDYKQKIRDEDHDRREIEHLKVLKEYLKNHPNLEERRKSFRKAMRGEK